MKYNIAANKSKFNRREILWKSLCGSLPAEKLGHGQFFFETFFLHCRDFLLSWSDTFYINRVPLAPVAPVCQCKMVHFLPPVIYTNRGLAL